MDFFESHLEYGKSLLHPRDQLSMNRERNAPLFLSTQRNLVLDLAKRLVSYRSNLNAPKEVRITQYDERLTEHIKHHGGWTDQAKLHWQKQGRDLKPAEKRLENLRKSGFLTKKLETTPKFDTALTQFKEKLKDRHQKRIQFFRETAKQRAIGQFNNLSKEQQKIVTTLGAFRQMTPAQAKKMGACNHDLGNLQKSGVIEKHHLMVEQKRLELFTLTDRNGRQASGKDLAKHGAGLSKPATGVHRDQSKLLHDVSVIDAIEDARGRFEKKGFRHVATLSEHQMYQTKSASNSDTGAKYADAYLTFKSPGGDDYVVAVEFGNYRPSYMKEKMSGIEADEALVYTHDESRAQEYSAVLAEIPHLKSEVHVIPTPFQEVDR